MVRTKRESDRRRDEKWQTFWCSEASKELAEWRRLQKRNLSILGRVKKKLWSQCHRASSWQVCQSRLCQREKEQSRQYRAPDREGERVKVSESRTLARERGRSEREHGEDRMDSTVKKGGFQGGELL